MGPLGLSSGFAVKHNPKMIPTARGTIRTIRDMGCTAIEISCLGGESEGAFDGLKRIRQSDLADFEHVSIHAPGRDYCYADNRETHELLDFLDVHCVRLGIACVVFHPHLVRDWHIFGQHSLPCAFENMDIRSGRERYNNPGGFRDIARKYPDFRFVLDLAHCYMNDPSMDLARDFYREFADNLAEIHISGVTGRHHTTFTVIDRSVRDKIIQNMPDKEVPVIIEASCYNAVEAKKDFDLLKKR